MADMKLWTVTCSFLPFRKPLFSVWITAFTQKLQTGCEALQLLNWKIRAHLVEFDAVVFQIITTKKAMAKNKTIITDKAESKPTVHNQK